jgi:hypothetical protein
MSETTETLMSKKLDRSEWNSTKNVDNFKEAQELTVTITLAEYRDLIKDNATSSYKISKKVDKISDLEDENKKLKEQVKILQEERNELLQRTKVSYTTQFNDSESSDEE